MVGGVVLIGGLAIAVGTAGGKRAPDRTATPAPATSILQAAPPAVSGPPSPTGAPSPSSARPVVRWHGTVTVSGPDAHKDLDSVPPRTYTRDSDVRGDWLTPTIKSDTSRVQFAVLKSGTAAGFTACRDAVAANGSDRDVDLVTGDVVCLVTSQGRVAMLRTTRATQTSTDPILTFTATVWDPPQPSAEG